MQPSAPQPLMSSAEWRGLQRFLVLASGLALDDNKQYLAAARLRPIMRMHHIDHLNELLRRLASGTYPSLAQEVIEAMTTQETSWFRDQWPFQLLRERIFPALTGRAKRPLQIWSAACANGMEPYSISMAWSTYQRQHGLADPGPTIFATDISAGALKQARDGIYHPQQMTRGLDEADCRRYFRSLGEHWIVIPEVRNRVTFRQQNLLKEAPLFGPFDIVFCRNVLIYMPPDLRSQILRQVTGLMRPGGVLFLGATESPGADIGDIEPVYCRPGIYYRRR